VFQAKQFLFQLLVLVKHGQNERNLKYISQKYAARKNKVHGYFCLVKIVLISSKTKKKNSFSTHYSILVI
jgi:hypothetical protein